MTNNHTYKVNDKVLFSPVKEYKELINDYNTNNIFENHRGTIKEIKILDSELNKENVLLYIQWDNITDLEWKYTHITPSNVTKIYL